MTDEQQPPAFYIHTDDFVEANNPRALQLRQEQTLPAIPDLFKQLEEISSQNSDVLNQLIYQVFNTPDLREQADQVQLLMQGLYGNAKWSITRLGQAVTIARDRKLYSYHDYPNMNSWIQGSHIDLEMALKAELLFKNVDFFMEIDQPYEEVVKANRMQVTAISEFKAEISTDLNQKVNAALPKTATPEERQQKYAELLKAQLPDIQAKVRTILDSPTEGELFQTLKKSAGTTVKACLSIKVTIDPRTRIVKGTFELPLDNELDEDDDEENTKDPNVFSNISNGFKVMFKVEGEDDFVSYIDLPEKVHELLEMKSTPSQQYMDRRRQELAAKTRNQANLNFHHSRQIDDRDYDPADSDDGDDNYI